MKRNDSRGPRSGAGSLRLLILVLLAGVSACRSYDQAPYPGDEAAGSVPVPGPYRIFAGDTLRLGFQYHPEWSIERLLVRHDGQISMPFLGQVQVAGRTLAELESELEQRLAQQIRDSDIVLDTVAYAERAVYVGGEVQNPGVVTFEGPEITLLQAIVKAGGPLKDSANLENVILAREDEQGVRHAWQIDLDPILTAAEPPQPVHLKHHDVVLVPNTGIDQANIFVDKYINRMIPGGALTALFLAGTSIR